MIEGKYPSLESLMADPASTTGDILEFAGSAEDAVESANYDKQAIHRVLNKAEDVEQPKKCRWWQRDC